MPSQLTAPRLLHEYVNLLAYYRDTIMYKDLTELVTHH